MNSQNPILANSGNLALASTAFAKQAKVVVGDREKGSASVLPAVDPRGNPFLAACNLIPAQKTEATCTSSAC
jgi:hypothetical protein